MSRRTNARELRLRRATRDGVATAAEYVRLRNYYGDVTHGFSMGFVTYALAHEYVALSQHDQTFADEWLTGVFIGVSRVAKKKGIHLDLSFVREDRPRRRRK